MLSKFNFISLRFVCSTALLCAVGLGCERPIAERHYTEIFVDAEKKAMRRSNDFSRMPQDDIHAKIMSPDASDSQAMPQDDIHSKLMPQDEIHAGLKAQNMPGADMMGGMQDPALQQQGNLVELRNGRYLQELGNSLCLLKPFGSGLKLLIQRHKISVFHALLRGTYL